jgi:hypothetical protein
MVMTTLTVPDPTAKQGAGFVSKLRLALLHQLLRTHGSDLDMRKFETPNDQWEFTARLIAAALTESDLIIVISNIEALVDVHAQFESFMKGLVGFDFYDGSSHHHLKIILTCSREDEREGLPPVFEDAVFGEWFIDSELPQQITNPDAPPRNAV